MAVGPLGTSSVEPKPPGLGPKPEGSPAGMSPLLARLRGPGAIYAGGLAIALVIAGLLVTDALETLERARKDAKRAVANLALIAEQEVERTLRGIDLSLKTVAEVTEIAPSRRLDDPAIGAAMKERLNDLPFASIFLVAGADGRAAQSTFGPTPVPGVALTDREYFAEQRDDAERGLFIGKPTIGRVSQRLSVPMSRRIGRPGRPFGGVAVAFVDSRAMAAAYGRLDVGQDGTVGLARADGTILARFPRHDEFVGRSLADTPLFREYVSGSASGVISGVRALDGVPRYYGYRRLASFPVFVFVGIEQARILRESLWSIAVDLGSAAVFVAIIALATMLLARARRRQDDLLRRARLSEDRFRDYTEAASDWHWETGPDHRLIDMSVGATAHGRNVALRMGKARWEIAADVESEPEKWREHRKRLERREPFRDFEYASELEPGVVVYNSVSGKPLFDAGGRFLGYRGTGRDTTAERSAAEAAKEARARLFDAIDALPDTIAIFDREDRLVVCNKAFMRPAYRDAVAPGTKFERVARIAAEQVMYPSPWGDTPDAWFAERMRRHANPGASFETRYKDGRWGRITELRTSDGGIVVSRTDITELKQAEQKANEARGRLFDAIESLPDGFALYDADDRLVQWNAAYARNSPPGVAVQSGILFAEWIAGIAQRVAVPNALGATREAWLHERVRRHRRPEGPFDVPRSDGQWLRIIESRTREGGVVSMVVDITERRHAEQEARQARARLNDAIESLPDGFALYDAEDRLVLWNAAYTLTSIPGFALHPGMPFAEIMAAVAGSVVFPNALRESPEAWVAERVRLHRNPEGPFDVPRSDGRWLRIIESRTREGGVVSMFVDVTERRRAEQDAREARARLADAIESLPDGFVFYGADERLVMCNTRYRQTVHPSIPTSPGSLFADVVAAAAPHIALPDDLAATEEEWVKERLRRHREGPWTPMERKRKDGKWLRVVEGRTGDGGTVILNIDITALKQAEQAAEQSRARLNDAIESLPDGFALFDAEDRLVMYNRAFRGFVARAIPLEPGMHFPDLIAEAAGNIQFPNVIGATPEAWLEERMRRHRAPGRPMDWQLKDGRWLRVIEGRAREGGTVVLNIDITALKAAEEAARRAHERMVDAIDSLPDPLAVFDRDDKLVHANVEYLRPLAVKPKPGVSTFGEVVPRIATQIVLPDALGATEAEWIAERLRRHKAPGTPFELFYKDGKWGRVVETRMRDGGTVMLRTDITGPKQLAAQQGAIAELSQQAAKTADPIALCQHAVGLIAKALNVELASALELEPGGKHVVLRAEVGWEPGSIGAKIPTGAGSLAGLTLAANAPLTMEDIERETRFNPTAMLRKHKVRSGMTVVIPGQPRPWGTLGAYSIRPRAFDRGEIDFMQAIAFVLSSTIERRKTEQALAQTQRLESLGQLTGGIAHDFNNLLTVIIGQSDLLARDLKLGDPHGQMAHAIGLAAQRAADLTSQLLAFARGQTLQPADIDPNALIAEIEPLLRRTLGEHIAVRTSLAPALPPCRADRSQLVAALVNLAVNARDAMAGGGSLTIETAPARLDADYAAKRQEVTPGDYVLISVSDTGTGMPPEVLERMFEPFFTTKPVGKGTGLGLSMVYGFVKQSGGHVAAYSEVGHGTTVKLYLPVVKKPAIAGARAAAHPAADAGGGETVLLVEDDAMVRAFAAEQLRRAGFRVIEAGDGPQALDRLRENTRVDLLFSDIVMPRGLSGPDLAKKARRLKPGLPVLLTSGYPAGALTDQKNGAMKFDLLDKPYTVEQLVRRIRAILDRR